MRALYPNRLPLSALLVATALAACAPTAPPPDPTAATPPPVADLMETARIPGLARATLTDGAVSEVEIVGRARAGEGPPVTETTLFEAASLSKPVFAAIVLRLAERGELDLDQPLSDLLPYDRISHDPRAERLTARLVLSHQTGLPNWGPEKLEFRFEPGEDFGYSGEGYVYLQRVVEHVTGQSLEELARREVFEPLGMGHSHFSLAEGDAMVAATSAAPADATQASPPGPATPALVLAVPHDRAGDAQEKRWPAEANAAASLHTTAADYARFVSAWMAVGGAPRLLAADTVAMALSPAVQLEPEEDDSPERRAVTERLAWGLGWGLYSSSHDAGRMVFHWGDNGHFKAWVAFDPDAGSGVVYFANGFNGLAIGEALTPGGDASPADVGAVLRSLGYAQSTDPGWVERLEGVLAEGDGRYGDAVAAFEAALATDPDDEETRRRIDWLTELIDARESPVAIPKEVLESYVGSYGPRVLELREGELFYQREGRSAFRLIPLDSNRFALEGLVDFRLAVVVDEGGQAVMLVGHYLDGSTDESPRSGPSQVRG